MRKAIILGATIAGYCAARSFLQEGIWPIILEPSDSILWEPARRLSIADTNFKITAELHLHQLIRSIYFVREEMCSILAVNRITGEYRLFRGDYFYSSVAVDKIYSFMGYRLGANPAEGRLFKNLVAAV